MIKGVTANTPAFQTAFISAITAAMPTGSTVKITSVKLLWSDGTVTNSRRRELLQATVVGVQVVYSVYSPTVSPADLDTLLANPTTLSAVNSNLVTAIPAAVVQAPLVLVPSSAPTSAPTFAPTISPTAPTIAPTNYPSVNATTLSASGPSQASSNTGVVAASVVGSLVALAVIVGGLWYYRKKLPVWKKNKGEKSAMVLPINVAMDTIPVAPPRLTDSQKECKSHSIRIWASEKSPKSEKADLGDHGEDDVALYSMSQKAEPISISEVPTRVTSPRGLVPLVINEDDNVDDDDVALKSLEADKRARAKLDSPSSMTGRAQLVMEGNGCTSNVPGLPDTSLSQLLTFLSYHCHIFLYRLRKDFLDQMRHSNGSSINSPRPILMMAKIMVLMMYLSYMRMMKHLLKVSRPYFLDLSVKKRMRKVKVPSMWFL